MKLDVDQEEVMAKGIGSSIGSNRNGFANSGAAIRSFNSLSLPKGKAQNPRQARGGLRKVKGLPMRNGVRALPSIPGMSGGQMPGGSSIGTGAGGVAGV